MGRILVGINYPWFNYGWDFGDPPPGWGHRAAWKQGVSAEFQRFRGLGLFAVRWFLLGNGLTYGVGQASPHLDSDPQRRGQWRFDDPPRLPQPFVDDFVDLLDHCKSASLKLLPSLIDFQSCFPGQVVGSRSGYVKGGRSDIINDHTKRVSFFDRVLTPLLQASSGYAGTIYAWELINEPDWVTAGSQLGRPDQRTVGRENMLAFIREGARRINAVGFKSTVGFARYSTLVSWGGGGVGSLVTSLHQFHYYADAPLAHHVFHPSWPAIVGEIATAPDRPWPGLTSQDVASRLRELERKGYPAAFLWSARAGDRATDWSGHVQNQVKQYIAGP